MFSRIVVSALFAGALAGLCAAALQFLFVQPVLLHAELYEGGDLTHFGGTANAAVQTLPGFDPLRDGLSVFFSMVVYAGYAIVLVAAMGMAELAGVSVTARSGLLWGIAGFCAVHLAPAFSLPPEVPGVAAADVEARQIWWFATVLSAAGAMALIAFGQGAVAWAGAAALLLAPHLIGAPEPEVLSGPVPPEIAALFAARALGTGLAVWAVLGVLAGYFWHREGQSSPSARTV